ncbi:MAG: LytTR family DNA-binding domain-containing protein [Hespellia sp.]|nr:LytTR family DNA-binding domain-containing protein [Hespellia sp.]
MEITICCNDEELMDSLVNHVTDYFVSLHKINLTFLSEEELSLKLKKKLYFCDVLIIAIVPERFGNTLTLITEIKANVPNFQLIGISSQEEERDYYPELFEMNLIYYLYQTQLETDLPKALDLAVKNLKLLENDYLICKSNHQTLKIYFDDIIYIEREMHTTKIFTKNNCYYIRRKLSELEEILANYPALVRCHMSFFVNCNYAVSFGNKKFKMKTNEIIPVSRKYYQDVKEYIRKRNGL